jgi:hydrogenase-4 membrane subunit HyfE
MIFALPSLTLFAATVFLLAILMSLVRKNTSLVMLYLLQSLGVTIGLISLAYSEGSQGLLYVALLTLVVKAVMAPIFLFHLIKRHSLYISATSYLSMPLTLLSLAVITSFSFSLLASHPNVSLPAGVPLLFASILCVFFLMVNRRGTLATIIGILALENGIVLLSAQLGLQHSFALEFAISFDIAVWTVIATGFLAMIYREFGTVDTASRMMHLTEE